LFFDMAGKGTKSLKSKVLATSTALGRGRPACGRPSLPAGGLSELIRVNPTFENENVVQRPKSGVQSRRGESGSVKHSQGWHSPGLGSRISVFDTQLQWFRAEKRSNIDGQESNIVKVSQGWFAVRDVRCDLDCARSRTAQRAIPTAGEAWLIGSKEF